MDTSIRIIVGVIVFFYASSPNSCDGTLPEVATSIGGAVLNLTTCPDNSANKRRPQSSAPKQEPKLRGSAAHFYWEDRPRWFESPASWNWIQGAAAALEEDADAYVWLPQEPPR